MRGGSPRRIRQRGSSGRWRLQIGMNGKSAVTVRELLTHYSGLPPDVSLKDAWGLSAPDKAEGIKRAMEARLDSEPGTRFVYSDVNFITLGAIVEKVSGEALDVYAERHIFGPLGMKEAGYHSFAKVCGPTNVLGAAIAYQHREATATRNPDGTLAIQFPGSYICNSGEWHVDTVLRTAPTQHDNEGTA